MSHSQQLFKRGAAALFALMLGVVGCGSDAPYKLEQVKVTPTDIILQVGETQQFTAVGEYGNGSREKQTRDITANDRANDRTTWVVSNPQLGEFSETTKGLLTALSPGQFNVSAFNGVFQGTTTVTVIPAQPKSIELSPSAPTVVQGTTLKLTAIATMPGNRTEDVSVDAEWTSDNTNVATVSNVDGTRGVVTGVTAGTAKIKAKLGEVVGEVVVTVADVELTEVVVTPSMPRIAKGTSVQLIASGKFSDRTNQNITTGVLWSTDDASIATVSNDDGKRGLVTGTGTGTVKITATETETGKSNFVNVNVTDASVVSISVSPTNPLVVLNTTVQLQALALLSDQTTLDVTAQSQWTSSNGTIATVSNDTGKEGRVSGLVLGDAVITASYQGRTDTTRVSVVPLSLTKLEIVETDPKAAKGTTLQLSAKGSYNDGSTKDLTANTVWSSSSSTTVKMDPVSRGLASALAVGTADITATFGTGSNIVRSEPVIFTVTPALLTKLDITPLTLTLEKGGTRQYTATGTFTDKSTQDMSSQVVWTSSNDTVASITTTGLATGLFSSDANPTGPLSAQTTITCALNGISSTAGATLTVTDNPLTKIEVTAAQSQSLTLPKGKSVQLVATGTFRDNTTQVLTTNQLLSWDSSNKSVATISPAGLVTTGAIGTTDITAMMKGVTSTAVTITVTAPEVQSIAISPSTPKIDVGATQQFTATGFYTDNTSAPLNASNNIQWISETGTVATIDPTGLAAALSAGTTKISAKVGSVTSGLITLTVVGLNSITITPVPAASKITVVKGTSRQLKATGNYSDSTTRDLTALANWTSSDETIATVSNDLATKGLLDGIELGNANVTATFDGKSSNPTAVSVTNATLQSIAITPTSATLAAGEKRQFAAEGTYSDGTNTSKQDVTAQVTWFTSNGGAVSIEANTGLASAVAAGSANIFATMGSIISNQASVTVNPPAIISIALSPVSPVNLTRTQTQQFTALATYSDTTTADVTATATWASSATTVVTMHATTKGLATAVGAGSSNITAKVGTVTSAPVTVNVPASNLVGIAVNPSPVSVKFGETATLSVLGSYDDSTTNPVTTGITWAVGDETIATVSAAGVLTAKAAGSTTVTATVGSFTSTPVTVNVIGISSIAVTATSAALEVGQTLQLTATATYADNSTGNVTAKATWTPSDAAIATVSAAGVLTGKAQGNVTVTAAFGGATSSAYAVTVNAATVCTLKPVINELQVGSSSSADSEFVELFNPCSSPANIGGWKLVYRSATGSSDLAMVTFSANATIPANGYYLVGHQGSYSPPSGVTVNATFTQSLAGTNGGGVALKNGNTIIDSIGWSNTANVTNGFVETTKVNYSGDASPAVSMQRTPNGTDTNNNKNDFTVAVATPGATNTP